MSSISGFKVSPQRQDPKVVSKAVELKTYLVEYTDGEGLPQTRVVFSAGDSAFIINDKIHGIPVATNANPWFQQAFLKLLKDGEKEEVGSI